METVESAIERAELLLPGKAAPDGAVDPRWQAIVAVAEFIPTNPEAVWAFLSRWAEHADEDLEAALATCVLEHILEHHFAEYFPRVEAAARRSPGFAALVTRCWKMGEAEQPANAARLDQLQRECQSCWRTTR